MIILIHNELFSDSTSWRDLDSLLDRARDMRCYVDALNPESVSNNDWLNQLNPSRRADWINLTDWAARDKALFRLRPVVAAKVTNPSVSQHRLADVIRIVDRTMHVWVENDRGDRRFWLSMMTENQRSMFLDFEMREIFQFSSRGGLNELRVSLEEQIARGAFRERDCWVLFDSDGAFPAHRSKEAIAMADFCDDSRIPYYCLSRRAIENYIPLSALWWWASNGDLTIQRERQKKIEAFERMTTDQQQHYHLKTGWLKDPSAEVKALYASLPESDVALLKGGIAKDIASLYHNDDLPIYEWAENEGMDAGVQATVEALANWIRVPYA